MGCGSACVPVFKEGHGLEAPGSGQAVIVPPRAQTLSQAGDSSSWLPMALHYECCSEGGLWALHSAPDSNPGPWAPDSDPVPQALTMHIGPCPYTPDPNPAPWTLTLHPVPQTQTLYAGSRL